MPLVLKHVSIFGDDVVEGDLRLDVLDLADSVDGAHDELVEVSVSEESRLYAEEALHDRPNLLLDVVPHAQYLG